MGLLDRYKPEMAMIGLQFLMAGIVLSSDVAFQQGLSTMVLTVYRQAIAALVMAPIAYLSRRETCGEIIAGRGFAWILVAGFIGPSLNSYTYFQGLKLSSPTMASTISNTVPAVTFIFAAAVGMEKVNIRCLRGVAKIIGTIICVGGAICMALVKGPALVNTNFLPRKYFSETGSENWLLGSVLLFGSSCCWSIWLVLQVPISARCPDHLLSCTWMCFFGSFLSAILTIFIEQSPESWKPRSHLEYACLFFVGIASAVDILVQAWCTSQRGPVFSAIFSPLCTVIVTTFSVFFVHEKLYSGSLAGAFGVIIGLYVVLWCKSQDKNPTKQQKDQRIGKQVLQDESSGQETCEIYLEEPLLSNRIPGCF